MSSLISSPSCAGAGVLPLVSEGREDSIVSAEKLTVEVGSVAIRAINASVGWSGYDRSIVSGLEIAIKSAGASSVFLFHKTHDTLDGFVIVENTGRGTGYIPFIAVDQTSQKKGVGSALMLAAIEKIKLLGFKYLMFDYRNSGGRPHFYSETIPTKAHVGVLEMRLAGEYSNGDPRMHILYDLFPKPEEKAS